MITGKFEDLDVPEFEALMSGLSGLHPTRQQIQKWLENKKETAVCIDGEHRVFIPATETDFYEWLLNNF